jgi:type I restriction enzyme, S subunit
VKLETFFEKFDEFADAPDAVAKMRELVLELAVKGKLTSALPEDGTVPSANEFREAASALANSLGLRPPQESVEEAEPPYEVPSHWRWMTLGDIGAGQTGTTPSKADHDAFNGDVPFIKPADILPNSIDYANESLTRRGAEGGSRIAPQGSLLMVCIGTIGKCNVIERECAFNQQINALTPVEAVDARYLLVAARSRSFQGAAWDKSSSTTIPILNKGKWLSIPVPLPPLTEQKRIVAKVNELMALCDGLEVQQQERDTRHAALARASLARFADAPTPANLSFLFHPSYVISPADLRDAILTLAIQGKLVPQDPNDEPPLALLERISALKSALAKEGKLRGSTSASPMADDEAEFEIPPSWCWVRFGEIMINRDGERIPVSREERASKTKTYDYYGASGVIDKIDGFLFDKPLLLIGEDGANLINRSTPIAFIARGQYWVNNHAHVLDGISEDFLQFIALHINAINLERYVTGSAQPKMNQAKMNSIPIALPPLAEQCRIVAKVDELMALVDALEAQLTTARTLGVALVDAVVAELTAEA